MSELATSEFVQTPALRMHYAQWSRRGAPIVLLHGLSSTLHIWDLVAPQLADVGQVIALDQRGHGLTEQPDEGYDLDTSSADVLSFLHARHISEPVWLIGHSWGAGVALNTASRYPQQVRGLVLVDGGIGDLKHWLPNWAEAEARLTPPSLSHLTLNELRSGMRERWLKPAWSPEVEAAALHGFITDTNGNVQRRLNLTNHMKIAHSLWQFSPDHHLPHLTRPTLICPARTSDGDPAHHAARSQRIETAARLINAPHQLHWFNDTIHDIPWHRPAELAQTIHTFIQG